MSRGNGFTLTELLVALALTSLVISGVAGFFALQKRLARQEAISASIDDALRIALMRISDPLRDAGYGVPKGDLSLWVPWVDGFASNPQVRDDPDGAPDAIDIALCRPGIESTLDAAVARGATSLHLEDPTLVDAGNRRLVSIGGREPAHVLSKGGAVAIDTDPADAVPQGVVRAHFAGTPVCRVDVTTFAVDVAAGRLTVDRHDGAGPVGLIDHVVDLQVETVEFGRQYRIALTARSPGAVPGTAGPVTRSASTLVTVRN